MLIIADSGSTKADWKIIDKDAHRLLSTIGFNPYFVGPDDIEAELRKDFTREVETELVTQVFFYGAGCSDELKCSIIEKGLSRVFTKAKIEVMSDLLAAARATCFNEAGVACILGTGSNSCQYDGQQITDNISSLAYLLGDEGSGSHLGKELIRTYFYREMPKDILAHFEEKYPGGKRAILDNIYGASPANVYLASFAKFLSDHKEHFFVQKLVFNSFAAFVDRHVRKYENHAGHSIHFVGSVAFHFKEIMNFVLQERGLELGKVIQKPIDNLVRFHLK